MDHARRLLNRSPRFHALLRLALAFLASVALLAPARMARAQSWSANGLVGLGTGLEGGNPGDGSVAWHRARTRATVGLDLAVDEAAYQAFGFRAFVELEHRATIGASLHYAYWINPNIGVFGGFTGVIAPKTLAGVEAGATFIIPLGKTLGIFIEPSLAALPIGSDLPSDSVIIWGLVSAGVRLSL